MNKERLMIYPFSSECSPVIRHVGLLQGYDITSLVSPSGWGFNEKDAGIADGGENTGIIVKSDFDSELKNCDAVLFVDSCVQLNFEKNIYAKMVKAINSGKKAICAMELQSKISEELIEKCEDLGIRFMQSNSSLKEYINNKNTLYNIKTPVIFVLGIAEKTNKFEIQLSLRENLMNMGYEVSQIGTKNYCELFGFHSFPDFMYTNRFESEKITMFNQYVKKIEYSENPDVIIIGIPGGTMAFNNKFTNRFGILAYEVSNAITPDAAVFSTLFEGYKTEFFDNIFNSVKYKLGFEPTCYNFSNSLFDFSESDKKDNYMYTTVGSLLVDTMLEQYSQMKQPVFNVLNNDHVVEMTNLLVDKLAQYATIETYAGGKP